MTKIIVGLFCLLFVQTSFNERAWSESYKLSWSDFVGSPNQNSDAAATTASGITFGYNAQETNGQIVSFKASVTAHFYPDKSWVKPELATDHILGHEQLHFDITELHARKLRQLISTLEVSNTVAQQLDNLHLNVNKALSDTQRQYDTDSDFSRNKEGQARWQKFVKEELKKLKAYK